MFDFFRKKKKDYEIEKEFVKDNEDAKESNEEDIKKVTFEASSDGQQDDSKSDYFFEHEFEKEYYDKDERKEANKISKFDPSDDLIEEVKVDDPIDSKIEEDNDNLGFFDRLMRGLTKTRDKFSSQIKDLFTANVKIDDELYEELEEILISADIGMSSTLDIVDRLRDEISRRKIKESDQIYPVLKEIMVDKLKENNLDNALNIKKGELSVILVIGVNGVGKTTTIGKLSHNLKKEGYSVMLAAADTFRAAAIEQLGEWADRADVEMISHKEGSDPSAVIFDAIKSAKSKNIDVLICDTAGRLHNKKNLMKELEKINKTIDTHAGKANRENILILDATTGQNAISQLREFKNVTDITGLILTKLDGTAKGGVIFPLQVELNVPVKYIGIGEGIDNLEKFDSDSFIEAMF